MIKGDRLNPTLARLGIPEFRALPPFLNGHAQTIAAALWPKLPDLQPTFTGTIDLPDGDQLVVLFNEPAGWKPTDRTVVLVHGLAGNHQSNYMIRLAYKLNRMGCLVVRVNLRGCGPGFGMARRPYHSGRSEDVREVLRWLARQKPSSPVTVAGFSLGANITLKLAGEDGATPSGNLDSVIAVSPPAHLPRSAERLRQSQSKIYTRYFLRKLVADVARARTRFPDIPELKVWNGMHLTDFDDAYTAPQSGYQSAAEYYEKAASLPVLDKIQVPTLILTSADDPVVDSESIRKLPPRPGFEVIVTEGGGHVAFLARSIKRTGIRWMDAVILKWLEDRMKLAAPSLARRGELSI